MNLFEMLAIAKAPTFTAGQQLDAASLNGIGEFNIRMRQLHNLTLHGPGIGGGMAVLGKKGDAAARVQPGYAIDYLGRELILTDEKVMPAPREASASYYLTASFTEDTQTSVVTSRRLPSRAPGATRLVDQATISWVKLNGAKDKLAAINHDIGQQLKSSQRLVLALVEIQDSKILAIHQHVRYSARFQTTPQFFGGYERVKANRSDPQIVRTAAAGFATEPVYFVQPVGEKQSLWMAYLVKSERHQFSVQIIPRDKQRTALAEIDEPEIDLAWLGIEGAL